MNRPPARVVLIDDHPVVREGLAAMITLNPQFTVVAQSSTRLAARPLWSKPSPDLVLTDFYLGDGTALDIVSDMHAAGVKVPTLVLSISGSDQNVFRALQSGIAGYILKSSTAEELFEAMNAVLNGFGWIGNDLRDGIIRHSAQPSVTDREREVLGLLATGCSNDEIAKRLTISITTAKTHVAHCLQKLAAKNRLDAVAKARCKGILPP